MPAEPGQDASAQRARRRKKKPVLPSGSETWPSPLREGFGAQRGGAETYQGEGLGAIPQMPSKDVIHHHPPREMAGDVGNPVRGGQTLLIAYFPWEASEADVEREFAKFSRVKRVHLVVDKTSRKPRCFGFVKFMTKADAEEALRATMGGSVQLPDTRGHVWHLKAEWTKSGDMVVDDSDAELEVAKRKEERRSRGDPRGGCASSDSARRGMSSRSGRLPTMSPKGSLHPGVPAPLPPLQPPSRYPPGQVPLFPSHNQSPHGGGFTNQALFGGGVAMYNGQQGQHPVFGGHLSGAALPYGIPPQLPHDGASSMATRNQDSSALLGGHSQQSGRDAQASLTSYGSSGQGYTPGQSYNPQAYGGQAYALGGQAGFPGQAGPQAPVGYATAPQQGAYAPQSCPHPQGFASQPGVAGSFGPPPGYSQTQGYPPPHPGYGNFGLYGYLQQPGGAPATGVMPYGSFPGTQAAYSQSHSFAAQADEGQTRLGAQSGTSTQPLPAPPAQQPPAPPAGHAAFRPAAASQAVPVSPGRGPSAVWNSFDDAAAKGMVDGLVGGEDSMPAPGTYSA
mmetsp:Transcript_69251/g.150719  ORF Transcript_69251/g.150719 Transcript_69251/m.150719 type:complete len:564 (+) Transcript_69251:157-1848(+)